MENENVVCVHMCVHMYRYLSSLSFNQKPPVSLCTFCIYTIESHNEEDESEDL